MNEDNGKKDELLTFYHTAGYLQVCIQEPFVSGTTSLRYENLVLDKVHTSMKIQLV